MRFNIIPSVCTAVSLAVLASAAYIPRLEKYSANEGKQLLKRMNYGTQQSDDEFKNLFISRPAPGGGNAAETGSNAGQGGSAGQGQANASTGLATLLKGLDLGVFEGRPLSQQTQNQIPANQNTGTPIEPSTQPDEEERKSQEGDLPRNPGSTNENEASVINTQDGLIRLTRSEGGPNTSQYLPNLGTSLNPDYFSKPNPIQNLMRINQQPGVNKDVVYPLDRVKALPDSIQKQRDPVLSATDEKGVLDPNRLPHILNLGDSAGYYGDFAPKRGLLKSLVRGAVKKVGGLGIGALNLVKYPLGRPANKIPPTVPQSSGSQQSQSGSEPISTDDNPIVTLEQPVINLVPDYQAGANVQPVNTAPNNNAPQALQQNPVINSIDISEDEDRLQRVQPSNFLENQIDTRPPVQREDYLDIFRAQGLPKSGSEKNKSNDPEKPRTKPPSQSFYNRR